VEQKEDNNSGTPELVPPGGREPAATEASAAAAAAAVAPQAAAVPVVPDSLFGGDSTEDDPCEGREGSSKGTAPMDYSEHGGRSVQCALEKLLAEIRDCQEHMSRSEERARKAEEHTQRLEEELGYTKQQLDDVKQQQRRRKKSGRTDGRPGKRARARSSARAGARAGVQKGESNSSQMLREFEQQIQSLWQKCSDGSSLMTTIQGDLDQERGLRRLLKEKVCKDYQNALSIAESAQQDVQQLRQERNSDEDRVVALAVREVERSTMERLDVLECKIEKYHLDQHTGQEIQAP